jgi:hypothetical protein
LKSDAIDTSSHRRSGSYMLIGKHEPEDSMPKGPKGEKRPADVIGNAVHVMRIATGEEKETVTALAGQRRRKGGLAGGAARAEALTPEQRAEIARTAAEARWKKR